MAVSINRNHVNDHRIGSRTKTEALWSGGSDSCLSIRGFVGSYPSHGVNFLQQEIHPHHAALHLDEVNGYLAGFIP